VTDVNEILAHWKSAEQYWLWQEMVDTPSASHQVQTVRKLITLWENILQRKLQDLPCMDLLREHRQTA
jgi:inorganic triphosphatase YgiF